MIILPKYATNHREQKQWSLAHLVLVSFANRQGEIRNRRAKRAIFLHTPKQKENGPEHFRIWIKTQSLTKDTVSVCFSHDMKCCRLSQSPSTRGLGMSRTKDALSRLRRSRSSLRYARQKRATWCKSSYTVITNHDGGGPHCFLAPGVEGEGLPYEMDGDARRLAYGL